MTVDLAKAANIRVDACRKHLAFNWERSEGESGAKRARSRRTSCCLSFRKAKVHRNFPAWEPIPPKQPRTNGKKGKDSSTEFFMLCKVMVLKLSLVNIPSGLPTPISSNHSTDFNINNKIRARVSIHGIGDLNVSVRCNSNISSFL